MNKWMRYHILQIERDLRQKNRVPFWMGGVSFDLVANLNEGFFD